MQRCAASRERTDALSVPGVAQLAPLDEILGGNKIAEPSPTIWANSTKARA